MSHLRTLLSVRRLTALAAALASLLAGVARASPLFELVGGVGDRAGFNGRATGASAASAYFNPALLPKATPGGETGLFLLRDMIEIELDPRADADVPLEYLGATAPDGSPYAQPPLPTIWLREGCSAQECTAAPLPPRPRQGEGSSDQTNVYLPLGIAMQVVGPQLALGLYTLVPLPSLLSNHAFYVDEREQYLSNSLHAELYSTRLTPVSFALGAGSQLLPRLSIGISFALGLHNDATAEAFVGNPEAAGNMTLISTEAGAAVRFAPHFGVTYDPLDRLHLSATLHTVEKSDLETVALTRTADGNQQRVTRTEVLNYMPLRFGLGCSVDVIAPASAERSDAPASAERSEGHASAQPLEEHALSLVATGVLGRWSSYRDRRGNRPSGAYAWSNTLSIAAGARHSYGPLRSFLDLQYVPTPVPLQTGRSNYVDNDRISATGGVAYEFSLLSMTWRLGLQAQVHALLQRDQRKLDPLAAGGDPALVRDEFPDDSVDAQGAPIPSAAGLQTNNPGWPGFASHGVLIGGGLTLGLVL